MGAITLDPMRARDSPDLEGCAGVAIFDERVVSCAPITHITLDPECREMFITHRFANKTRLDDQKVFVTLDFYQSVVPRTIVLQPVGGSKAETNAEYFFWKGGCKRGTLP